MIDKDIKALNDHFFDNIGAEDIQIVVENQPDEDIDDARVWTKWIIVPGLSETRSMGIDFLVTQYGVATLQIFIPKGQYTGEGNDLRERFNTLFRGWRSADKKLIVDSLKSESSSYTKGDSEFHLINAKVMWRSNRRTSDQ